LEPEWRLQGHGDVEELRRGGRQKKLTASIAADETREP